MGDDAISIVSALNEAGNVDTMYRDVYLGRARTLSMATSSGPTRGDYGFRRSPVET